MLVLFLSVDDYKLISRSEAHYLATDCISLCALSHPSIYNIMNINAVQIRKRLINVCVEKTPCQEQERADGFIRVELEHSLEITTSKRH
jgi:hypothetical protein